MQYEKVYNFLINKLETGLPSYLTYHNALHTKSVIDAAEHLAKEQNISGDDLLLLKTAALFHDAGFLQHHHEHEEISCKIARKHLPEYDYTPEQIEIICRTIMATKLPQTPADQLGQLLCDADLYYLGGEQYTTNAEKLFKEFNKLGIVKTQTEWELKQVEFLSAHHYFTQTAINERKAHKQNNLHELKLKLESLIAPAKKINIPELIQDFLFIIVGVVFAGFALKGFLVPNHFFDGGITGVSLLVHDLYFFNLAVAITLLNLPFIIISYFSVGKKFAFRTLISVLLLGICLQLLPDLKLPKTSFVWLAQVQDLFFLLTD